MKAEKVKEKTKLVALSEVDQGSGESDQALGADYSVVSDVAVELEAYIGSTSISIKELFALKEGSVLPLNETVDAPIVLHLEGKPVASGELVVVGDNFGIKITEIIKSNVEAE